ncbi:MAG: hypothetical protein HQL49_07100 [Gammaproteobacteria bacterium]|nr:hypothetical protein [Gammaproteobacteria bacterium]
MKRSDQVTGGVEAEPAAQQALGWQQLLSQFTQHHVKKSVDSAAVQFNREQQRQLAHHSDALPELVFNRYFREAMATAAAVTPAVAPSHRKENKIALVAMPKQQRLGGLAYLMNDQHQHSERVVTAATAFVRPNREALKGERHTPQTRGEDRQRMHSSGAAGWVLQQVSVGRSSGVSREAGETSPLESLTAEAQQLKEQAKAKALFVAFAANRANSVNDHRVEAAPTASLSPHLQCEASLAPLPEVAAVASYQLPTTYQAAIPATCPPLILHAEYADEPEPEPVTVMNEDEIQSTAEECAATDANYPITNDVAVIVAKAPLPEEITEMHSAIPPASGEGLRSVMSFVDEVVEHLQEVSQTLEHPPIGESIAMQTDESLPVSLVDTDHDEELEPHSAFFSAEADLPHWVERQPPMEAAVSQPRQISEKREPEMSNETDRSTEDQPIGAADAAVTDNPAAEETEDHEFISALDSVEHTRQDHIVTRQINSAPPLDPRPELPEADVAVESLAGGVMSLLGSGLKGVVNSGRYLLLGVRYGSEDIKRLLKKSAKSEKSA